MRFATSLKAFDLTDEMRVEAARVADTFKVCPDLDDRDQLMGWSIDRMKRPSIEATKGYIVGGYHDALKVKDEMVALGLTERRAEVLEFAAGFGRVTRHLKVLVPGCVLTASDIHRAACDFIRDKMGVSVHQSTFDPAELGIDKSFSFIFVLSFFSHLPGAPSDHGWPRSTASLSPKG